MMEPKKLYWQAEAEIAFQDLLGLARSGELTSRALEEESDQSAFGAHFRAVQDRLVSLEKTIEEAKAEWLAMSRGPQAHA